tara:strand:+ start:400 stop:606 length:207 start_codon:yes stop_codon:yes gene_type:complete
MTNYNAKYFEVLGEHYVNDDTLSVIENKRIMGYAVMAYKKAHRTPEELEIERVFCLERDAYYARNGGD